MTTPIEYTSTEAPEIGDGSAAKVAEGLLWLRMPVSGSLEAINVWALADGDDWTLVDTGLRNIETATAWQTAFATTLEGRPVRRVIVTHLHPDHSGMAGWIVQKQSARLWMSRLEYMTLRVLAGYTGQEAPEEAIGFYRAAGWDEKSLDRYRARFGDFGKPLYPLPNSFWPLHDGQALDIGGRCWEIVVGRGHSPEHAMLYCREAKLLISGDQVLPAISSNISVQPMEPEADPLSDWLESLRSIRERVSDDVLVLPAHGKPFRGLHARIDGLITGHEKGMARLLAMLETPKRAIDVFPALFRRTIDNEVLGLATGESLAHLACLRSRGLATRESDADGIQWWRAA